MEVEVEGEEAETEAGAVMVAEVVEALAAVLVMVQVVAEVVLMVQEAMEVFLAAVAEHLAQTLAAMVDLERVAELVMAVA